jgi:hypothetical protein
MAFVAFRIIGTIVLLYIVISAAFVARANIFVEVPDGFS